MSRLSSLVRKVFRRPAPSDAGHAAAEGKPATANAHARRRFARTRRVWQRVWRPTRQRVLRPVWRVARGPVRFVAWLLVIGAITTIVGLARSRGVHVPIAPPARPIVNDVTQLNPIAVASIVTPHTTEEVAAAIRASHGPLSIGGGRYSMGGQTATPNGMQLDLRELTGVVSFSPSERLITVRAGMRWRDVQRAIDSAGLAVKVMQTYNTFTVGGALSVNAHGRYIGNGPVAGTVRALRLVLADGSIVDASPTQRPDLFYGALGGYGGLGVITEATLDLAPNVKVRRDDESMPITQYREYFKRTIASDTSVIFHNGDIYPPAYDRVHAVSYRQTDQPLTVNDRLHPADQSSAMHRAAYSIISGSRAGPWIREHVIDPVIFRGNPVTWRNYEASYDVSELEPSSRARSTYVLQEYFIPVDSFDVFVPRLRRVLREYHVNAVNVSIRHALADPGTLLAWGPTESYAFVLYYKQDTDPIARHAVGRWTRALVDAALASGGRWYLPYQPHATRDQFRRGYPRSTEYFALKRRVDPNDRFTNTLWDVYAPAAGPNGTSSLVDALHLPAAVPGEVRMVVDTIAGYQRDESAAFLTHPEWDLVYTSDAYADWLGAGKKPSGFPYTASVGTFWRGYWGTWRAARPAYDVPLGTHVMLVVIGASTAVEYGLKALYENTIGRVFEVAMPAGGTAEDKYAARVARDYGRLIHDKGWYEFCFSCALSGLWRVTWSGPGWPRKIERRFFLSAEYGIKAVYATVIALGTQAGYAPDETTRHLLVAGWADGLPSVSPPLNVMHRRATLDRGYALVTLPRYDAYRDALVALSAQASTVRLAEANGCETITLVANVPARWAAPPQTTPVLAYADPVAPTRTRVLLRTPVRDLLDVLARMRATKGVRIEHVYDY